MILVVRLRGVATEAIKNMVLAGIGKLIVVDSESVVEEDLGCGFFFRDEDVGQKVERLRVLFGVGYLLVIFRLFSEARSRQTENRKLKPPRGCGNNY